ncbi:MAG: CRISPR-associated protein Cas4 [Gammaproteobacteria bacterium]
MERAVTRGAIYHQQSRRRREVIVHEALRREVEDAVAAVRTVLAKTERPPPVEDARRCGECSLREICQPELARAEREIMGLKAHLFEPEDEAL